MTNGNDFERYLRARNLSENTVCAYLLTVKIYDGFSDALTKESVLAFKGFLIEKYKPRTVNLRIQAMNEYLKFKGKERWRLSSVPLQQRIFIENVISNADYVFLKNSLKRDGDTRGYFIVRFLAATGARISELLQFKAEDVLAGYVDLYCKGGKLRRIYIPDTLKKEGIKWLEERGTESGYLFVTDDGTRLLTRSVQWILRVYADRYGIDRKVMHPHSFRHLFAKNFLEKNGDLSLLADLLGHASINTTRAYLRKTSTEQRDVVNDTVDW